MSGDAKGSGRGGAGLDPAMEWPPLRLDDQLCFSLYTASRLVTRAYRPLLDALGITYSQYIVLIALWEYEREYERGARPTSAHDEPLSLADLGRRLKLDSGTLTPLLRRLESAGLITRRRAEYDERQLLVALTDAGRELEAKAQRVPASLLCAHPGVDFDAVVDLKRTLDRFLRELEP